MAGTQVNQTRKAIIVEGTSKYSITTTCTVAGTIQDTHIFLLDIITDTDPKDDILNRVIEIADLTTYPTDRDLAVAQNTGAWRSTSVTLIYDDVATANAAWKEFSSRINTLVKNTDVYYTEFETLTEGQLITYPTADESAQTAVKAAYAATIPVLTAAQDAFTEQTTECVQLDRDLAAIESQLSTANADTAIYVSIQASLTAITASDNFNYGTLVTNQILLRTENGSSAATSTQKANIETVLVSNDAALVQFSTQNAAQATLLTGNVAAAVSTTQARVISLTQQKNTTLVELNNCHIESSKLQAQVIAAINAQEVALAAVVAICPDFTP